MKHLTHPISRHKAGVDRDAQTTGYQGEMSVYTNNLGGNIWVLIAEQNVEIDGDKQSGPSRSFQVGAANEKERRPDVVHMRRICRLCLLE